MKAEDLQYQKNATNRIATATVMWNGAPFLIDLPVDELLGLEARIQKIRGLIEAAPTLDATRSWVQASQINAHVWELEQPERTTKTEKKIFPIEMSPATDKHPAQVQIGTRDENVGLFTTMKRSGACTAVQKSNALVLVDQLLVEVKQARMRANETFAVTETIGKSLKDLLLSPFME